MTTRRYIDIDSPGITGKTDNYVKNPHLHLRGIYGLMDNSGS
jgi:hypothetical protein